MRKHHPFPTLARAARRPPAAAEADVAQRGGRRVAERGAPRRVVVPDEEDHVPGTVEAPPGRAPTLPEVVRVGVVGAADVLEDFDREARTNGPSDLRGPAL